MRTCVYILADLGFLANLSRSHRRLTILGPEFKRGNLYPRGTLLFDRLLTPPFFFFSPWPLSTLPKWKATGLSNEAVYRS